jgi:hypothetical protein
MSRSRMAVLAAVALFVISACGSSPGATQSPGTSQAPGNTTGATQQPVASQPAASQPAASQPASSVAGLTGHECDSVPTFSIDNPEPSFAPDPQLEAHFPADVNGNPVTNVSSQSWLDLMCTFGGQTALAGSAGQFGNLPLATMTFGSADVVINEDDISLSALRTPNQDAGNVIQYLAQIAALSNQGSLSGNVSQQTVGGKSVYVYTDANGAKSYAVPLGDTLVFFDSATDDEAAAIIGALK